MLQPEWICVWKPYKFMGLKRRNFSAFIEAEAARNKYVLVPEPGRPNNGVVTGRYAIARFNLEATGKPSHAGATLSSGRSAIHEMARQIIAIDGMSTEDCTFSVGIVHGGQWVNCVATTCTGEALSMAKRQADLDRGVDRMLALSGSANDVTFKVTRGVTRPVWEPDAGTMALYEKARGVKAEAARLQADLRRAGITPYAWIINQSFYAASTLDPVLAERGALEARYIDEVQTKLANRTALIPWQAETALRADVAAETMGSCLTTMALARRSRLMILPTPICRFASTREPLTWVCYRHSTPSPTRALKPASH